MKTFSQFLLEATDPKGPIKKYMSPEEIAKKHKTSLDTLNTELKLGIKVEKEHTGDEKMTQREIRWIYKCHVGIPMSDYDYPNHQV